MVHIRHDRKFTYIRLRNYPEATRFLKNATSTSPRRHDVAVTPKLRCDAVCLLGIVLCITRYLKTCNKISHVQVTKLNILLTVAPSAIINFSSEPRMLTFIDVIFEKGVFLISKFSCSTEDECQNLHSLSVNGVFGFVKRPINGKVQET